MAARKGLGRGLDSMFPRYNDEAQNTAPHANTEDREKEKSVKSAAAKDGKNKEDKKQGTKKGNASAKNNKQTTAEKTQDKPKTSGKNDHSRAEKNATDSTGKGTVTQSSAADVQNTAQEQKKVSAQAAVDSGKRTVREDGTTLVKLSEIEPNAQQPRREFNEDALQELADSIRQVGIIQPIVVQKRDDYYEIIAGERRWRAARLAGLKEVPVIIKDLTDKEILELSLIENLQREDLNPIEEAKAYRRLLDEFDLKQDELAERLSKSRSAITNSMRLLKLCDKVQEMLIADMISAGHARALLALEDPKLQEMAATQVFDEKLSVRETEKLVKVMLKPKTEKKETSGIDEATRLIYQDMEDKLRAALGTKVTVHYGSGKKGKLEIEYYSNEELERIYDLLCLGTGV